MNYYDEPEEEDYTEDQDEFDQNEPIDSEYNDNEDVKYVNTDWDQWDAVESFQDEEDFD